MRRNRSLSGDIIKTKARVKNISRSMYRANTKWRSLMIRGAILVYMLAVAQVRELFPEFLINFKYLTVWGWWLVFSFFFLSFVNDAYSRYHRIAMLPPPIRILTQTLSEIAFCCQVVVVAFFWGVVYPQESWRSISLEMHLHGMGLVLMVFDYLYRKMKFSLRNHRYVLTFAAVYSIIHFGFVYFTNKPVYPGMDFRDVFSILVFLAGLSTVVVVHKLVCTVAFFRDQNWDLPSLAYFVFVRQSSWEGGNRDSVFPRIGRCRLPGRRFDSYSRSVDVSRRIYPGPEDCWSSPCAAK